MIRGGRAALVAALLLAAGLAGCVGGEDLDPQALQEEGLTLKVTPESGDADTEFTFDASGTSGADDLNFTWDFGDGETANGQTVTHVFAYTNALYEVEVTATHGNQTFTDTIEVPVGSGENAAPEASISPAADWVGHGQPLNVSASATDPDGDPVEIQWLMAKKEGGGGDGHDHDHGGGGGGDNFGIPEDTGKTGEQATFTFEESGTYRLVARALDPKGASHDATVDIKVTQTVPKTTFTFEKTDTLAAGTGGAGASNELYGLTQPSQNTFIDSARYDVRLLYRGTGTFSVTWNGSSTEAGPSGPADLDLYLYNDQGETIQELETTDPTATSESADVDLRPGTYTIVVSAKAGANIPYTVTLDLDLLIPGLTVQTDDGHDDHDH